MVETNYDNVMNAPPVAHFKWTMLLLLYEQTTCLCLQYFVVLFWPIMIFFPATNILAFTWEHPIIIGDVVSHCFDFLR